MQETWVQSLGQEDPLLKEMATHPSTQTWKLQSMGWQTVAHNCTASCHMNQTACPFLLQSHLTARFMFT